MDEYVCVTLKSRAGESEPAFKTRLVEFWTHMLRNRPDDYERIYAEAVVFDTEGDRITRQYIVEPGVVELLERELAAKQLDHDPVDLDDIYTKSEASTSDWFQIEH